MIKNGASEPPTTKTGRMESICHSGVNFFCQCLLCLWGGINGISKNSEGVSGTIFVVISWWTKLGRLGQQAVYLIGFLCLLTIRCTLLCFFYICTSIRMEYFIHYLFTVFCISDFLLHFVILFSSISRSYAFSTIAHCDNFQQNVTWSFSSNIKPQRTEKAFRDINWCCYCQSFRWPISRLKI